MKKMKTLFKRVIEHHKVVEVLNEVVEGCEWVLNGDGVPTQKLDGVACMIKDGELYVRFDAKTDRAIPDGAIQCQSEPDPITKSNPYWVPALLNPDNRYKWFLKAYGRQKPLEDGTYEFVGPHINENPEKMEEDTFIRHGSIVLDNVPRTYEGIREYLRTHNIEGIVFHRENGDMCKIKRWDFGFEWNGGTGKRFIRRKNKQ